MIDVPEVSGETSPPYVPNTSCRPGPPREATTAVTALPSEEIDAERTSRLVPSDPPDGVVPVSVTLSSAPSRTMLSPTSVVGVASGSNALTSAGCHPALRSGTSGAPSALITYGPPMSAALRVQMICAASDVRSRTPRVPRPVSSTRTPPPEICAACPRSADPDGKPLSTPDARSSAGPSINLLSRTVGSASWLPYNHRGSDTRC
ncbi:Uncharacterised protein [Mycobacteroides abscessus subsp. abscessus]|nr:Uncharacterised protein [Mycobacteroides abscessus subsp. abscessus]